MNRKSKSKKGRRGSLAGSKDNAAQRDSSDPKSHSDSQTKDWSWDHIFSLTGFAVVAVVAGMFIYVPAFDSPFVLDSISNIEQNASIQDLGSSQWYRGQRWVALFTFAVDYALYGNSPWGFQLTNLIIHIFNAVLVFLLVDRTAGSSVQSEDFTFSFRRRFAFFSALVWFVHPLQTQAVVYHVQRMESLMSLFFLVTLYSVHRFIDRRQWAWLLIASLSILAAINTKEVGYVIPLVALSYAYVFGKQNDSARNRAILSSVGTIVVFGFIVVAFYFWRQNQMGGGDERWTKSVQYLAAQTHILFFYLKLVIWPVGQNIDHAWSYLSSPMEAALPGLVLLIAFGFGCWMTIQRRPLGWCVLSFFLILAPTSSLLPITDLAVEHRMYLPSLMIVLPLTYLGCWLSRRWEAIQIGFAMLLIVTLCFASHLRCQIWRSKISLWSNSVAGAPLNPRGHNNLAIAYAQQSSFDRSIASFERALDLVESPQLKIEIAEMLSHSTLIKRLGTVCLKAGDIEKAKRVFRRLMEFEEVYYYEWLEIANPFVDAGQSKSALVFFDEALKRAEQPDEKALVLVEYGHAYLDGGDPNAARRLFEQAVDLDGDNWKAHNNLGISIMSADQDIELAHKHFSEAVKHSNQTPEAMMNLARVTELMRANKKK